MAKFTLIDHENGTTKRIEYFSSARDYIKINFLGWGFYKAVYNGKQYDIYDSFDNKLVYTVTVR